MIEFLKILVSYFDENKIPYMLSGSVAMSIYSLPVTILINGCYR